MSLTDVETEILQPMQRLFLPPRNMDEGQQREALREYGNALQNFIAADLREAWRAVRDTHTTRSWPVPAAFILAARQARKDKAPNEGKANNQEQQNFTVAWGNWLKVCGSSMGKEAVRRNVAWALKCAILNDHKRPEEIDLRALVIAKASAEETASKIGNGEIRMRPQIREPAMEMWHTLQIREAETQDEIHRRGAA